MGNRVFSTEGGYVYANSPEHYDLNTSTIGSEPENSAFKESFHGKQASSLSQSLPLAAGAGSGIMLSGLSNTGKAAVGFTAGSGFDAAGQLSQNGLDEYRPMQTVISGTTTAIAAPYASANIVKNMFIGGTLGATNTTANNLYYNENNSVTENSLYGAGFAGLGTKFGSETQKWVASSVKGLNSNSTKINPNIPLSAQVYLKENPINELAGKAVNQTVSHIPVFLPKSNDEGNK